MDFKYKLWIILAFVALFQLEVEGKRCAICAAKKGFESGCDEDTNKMNCKDAKKLVDAILEASPSRAELEKLIGSSDEGESRYSTSHRRRKRDSDSTDYVCAKFVGEFKIGDVQFPDRIARGCVEEESEFDSTDGFESRGQEPVDGVKFFGTVHSGGPKTSAIGSWTFGFGVMAMVVATNL